MYQVEFQTHYENLIDVGTVIVCAGSSEAARDTVIALLELPSSRTVTNITRIKPSLFQISRKEITRNRKIAVPTYDPNNREQRERDPPPERFDLQVSAKIVARGEKHAMRKLVQALQERNGEHGAPVSKNIAGLAVNVTPQSRQRHLKPMESVELYRPKRFL